MPHDHFNAIFVDESGHAVEPECLIPLAGMLTPGKGQVVLAGDPKQLGPIVRSTVAKKSGLSMSLLERLMNRDPYKKTSRPLPGSSVLAATPSVSDLSGRFVTNRCVNHCLKLIPYLIMM